MFSQDIKLKIKENKADGNFTTPRFIVTYNLPKNYSEDTSEISHKIISLLNNENDIFIELNSSLLSVLSSEREKESMNFIKEIKSLNLDYRYRQLPGRSTGNIFSNLIKKGSSIDHEILTLVPKAVWMEDSFRSILPKYGMRYYICNENIDTTKILDDMYKGFILDEDKLKLFKYIIFDCNNLSQMGIVSSSVTLEELQKIFI